MRSTLARPLLLALIVLLAALAGLASFFWFGLDRLALTRRVDREKVEREAQLAAAAARDVAPAAERAPTPGSATADEVDGFDGLADPPVGRPLGEVVGTVRRARDGALVSEGAVVLTFVDLLFHELDRTRFLALDHEQQLALNDFDEAAIAPDGSFRCRLPCPSIVRRAVVRPELQGSRAAQFLETEQELGALELGAERPLALDLRVDDGAAIAGVVIAAQGGFPLRGARVSIPWWSDDWSDWACETDVDGRFRVAGIRREVAAAKSHSEAIVSLAGYVTRRFEVPPAGDDLDVSGLVLPLEAGVAVTVELVPPRDLEDEAIRDWTTTIATASAWLAPGSSSSTGAPDAASLAVVPWLALPTRAIAAAVDIDESTRERRLTFEVIPPTRDVSITLRSSDGRLAGPYVADGSALRPPQQFVVEWPPLAAESPGNRSATELEWRLVDRDGAPLSDHAVAWRRHGSDSQRGRLTTDERGSFTLLPLRRGDRLELRVARFQTVHLVALRDAATTAPITLSLEPLPSGR